MPSLTTLEDLIYLSHLEIENFRTFGEGDNQLDLNLGPGLNLIVGENNSGKSAIVDALRLTLGTSDHEPFRVTPQDFHIRSGQTATRFTVRCTFTDLDDDEAAMFVEWLHIVKRAGMDSESRLTVTLEATRNDEAERSGRFGKPISLTWRAGPDAEGRPFGGAARDCLRTTYLKPLRDAEQELKAKRGSRLSQIFSRHPEMEAQGDQTDAATLSGIMHVANEQLRGHAVLRTRLDDLNSQYLRNLTLGDDPLSARINIAPSSLRGILERLALSIADESLEDVRHGLGLDNLLFIATEFLLLQGPHAPLRLALIEEPEAHLHPQLQLRLVEFLEAQLSVAGARPVQVLLTSHSPNLASKVPLENVILVRQGQAYPLGKPYTRLDAGNYEHLRYFLDVTKANLFFARGVLIVEGPAEQLLLPGFADALGRPLSRHGVSIVNVGGVGLFHFARIFQRPSGGTIDIRVATITDRDVPPAAARTPLDGLKALIGESRPTEDQLTAAELGQLLAGKQADAGDPVRAFVSPIWTLEYDLARSGYGIHLFVACKLARQKGLLSGADCEAQLPELLGAYKELCQKYQGHSKDEVACLLYAPLARNNVSKTSAAYYLAWLFRRSHQKHVGLGSAAAHVEHLTRRLPSYLVDALQYVTRLPDQEPA